LFLWSLESGTRPKTGQAIKAATHTWNHPEAWHWRRSRSPAAVVRQQRTAPRGGEVQERRRARSMAPPVDPPDVEMEMDPAPQPPPPAVAPAPAAVGEGWSMLSRARGLLEEGKPSLALQAVRTLPPLPISVRSPFLSRAVSLAFVSTVARRPAMKWGIRGFFPVTYRTYWKLINRVARRSRIRGELPLV
jgi:hypothetical protein